MSRKIRLTPYEDDYNRAFDEREFDEDAAGADFREDESPSSMTIGHYAAPDNRMPMFLNSEDEAFLDREEAEEEEPPMRRGFGSGGDIRYRPSVWPRVLKVGMFTAAAAGIALAIASMDNPMGLFTNAKASLPGATADQTTAALPAAPSIAAPAPSITPPAPSVAPPPPPALSIAPPAPAIAPPPPTMQTAARVQAPPPAATARVSRGDIAAALRDAQQTQPEIPQPKAAAAPPPLGLPADELVNLMRRARALIEVGDVSPARLLLERAAEAQEASAALLLAQTYDPAVIGTQDLRSITADPALAKAWYQKAAELGSPEARGRLAQIQN
jgi:hypothetical protein